MQQHQNNLTIDEKFLDHQGFKVADDILCRQVENEAILLHIPGSMYYIALTCASLTLSDQFRYFLGITMTPTEKEWKFLPLPKFLCFLYYPLRPIRLIARFALSL